ncbi:MAG: hypothetical protein IJY22_04455, partial [Clostridia bacterium]|nr:hypothetical protein [Clostridia bacterium]
MGLRTRHIATAFPLLRAPSVAYGAMLHKERYAFFRKKQRFLSHPKVAFLTKGDLRVAERAFHKTHPASVPYLLFSHRLTSTEPRDLQCRWTIAWFSFYKKPENGIRFRAFLCSFSESLSRARGTL